MKPRALLITMTLLAVACGSRTFLGGGVEADGSPTGADASVGHAVDASSEAGADGRPSSCVDEVIARDGRGATVLAVDGDTVFWGTVDGRVQRHDARGNALLAQATGAIDAIAFDAARVYYAVTGELASVPRGGGASSIVAQKIGLPTAIAVDPQAIYVLDHGQGIAAGRVLRVEADGGSSVLTSGLDVPSGLAADREHLYVPAALVLIDGGAALGPLVAIPKAGGAPSLLLQGLKQPSGITTFGGRVYFIEQVDAHSTLDGGLRAIAPSGGPVSTIVHTPALLPIGVSVDAQGAAVTALSNTTGGALLVAALDGSGARQLASTPGVVYADVALAGPAVYWTIGWTSSAHVPADSPSVRKACR